MTAATLVLGQVILVALLAPLITGIIRRVKCRFQARNGPPLLQAYRDLYKLFRKAPNVSDSASWVFVVTPFIVLGSTLCAAGLLPAFGVAVGPQALGPYADGIVFVYFLGLARFFAALAAIDTAGSFGSMGASRDMFISSMVEPGLMGVLFLAGSAGRSLALPSMLGGQPAVAAALGAAALAILTVAETGRVPVDNPDTHLELTMVHEGMLLEYSGQYLALLTWASQVKQLLILSLLATVFVPALAGSGAAAQFAVYLAKVLILAVALALCECTYAKMRLFRVPSLLQTAWVLAALGAAASLFM